MTVTRFQLGIFPKHLECVLLLTFVKYSEFLSGQTSICLNTSIKTHSRGGEIKSVCVVHPEKQENGLFEGKQ